MEIKVIQCELGKFSFGGDNESELAFSAAIYHENEIVKVNNRSAIIEYVGNPEFYDEFRDIFENLEFIFKKCYLDSKKWIGSSRWQDVLTFAKVYNENYDEITANFILKRKEEIENAIKRFQQKIENPPDLPNLIKTANKLLNEEIDKYTKLLNNMIKDQEQIKEGSELFAKISKEIEQYQKEVNKYTSLLL